MKEIIIEKQLPVITGNFEEVKASLKENLEKYKGIVVTEDGLKDCKATQKDLSKLKKTIDTYRKDVKREVKKPIDEFEDKCKELISLIENVETPIKDGIRVFDEKKREEKRELAQSIIDAAITQYNLTESYSKQLTVIDRYLLISTSKKAIEEDIQARAMSLGLQQEEEIKRIATEKETIKITVESANETIKTKLDIETFYKLYDGGYSLAQVIKNINSKAELIREAEKPKPVEEPTPEPVQEPIQETIKIPVDTAQLNVQSKKESKKFYIKMTVTHDKEHMMALSNYLKQNGFDYEVKDKGVSR